MPSNERIGRALNSHNLRSDEQHSDIDIVGALAFSSPLGASLQALFSAGHQIEMPRAVELLSRTLIRASRRKRIGLSVRAAGIVSRQALIEWHLRVCRFCNGTGKKLLSYSAEPDRAQQTDGDKCAHCNGSGEIEPTWAWRAKQMFDSATVEQQSEDYWTKRLDLAREIAEGAYRAAGRRVSRQLAE